MKRGGNLWPKLVSFANLLWSAQKAEEGKRYLPPVLRFNGELERELWRFHQELLAKTWQPEK